MDPLIIVSAAAAIGILFLFSGSLHNMAKMIGRGFVKLLIGAFMLFILNLIGTHFDIHVPINIVTTAVSGFLGIPGVAALVVIDQWII